MLEIAGFPSGLQIPLFLLEWSKYVYLVHFSVAFTVLVFGS